MIRKLLQLLWWIVWGTTPTRGRKRDVIVTDVNSERAKPIRYGRMVIQIFLNRRKDGRLNPKMRIRRAVGREGSSLVDNFFLEDIDDVERCLIRAKAWIHDTLELE